MIGSIGWNILIITVIPTVRSYLYPEVLDTINVCINKQTCQECIQTPDCAWCAEPDFTGKRCFLFDIQNAVSCEKSYIMMPQSSHESVRHDNLTKSLYNYNSVGGISSSSSSSDYHATSHFQRQNKNYVSSKKQEAVHIWPQEINLKLRINEAYKKISFAYFQAKDYPVDLYYLMDLSKSMENDKEKLTSLADLFTENMNKITSNFRLGFGSFIDKVAMPFSNTMKEKLERPCPNCGRPYGYKHIMKLSNDTSSFKNLVNNTPISGNLDGPEGGFDAIMQAIVCKEEIGWREKARKLLVFSTDGGFHYAGDGKLAGIVKPNDGACHLNNEGSYTQSLLLDYPSVSQINLKVKQNSVNVIWAVTEDQMNIYQELTEFIEGSSAGTLANDSSNIVELIRNQYELISTSVEIRDTASSAIKVKYWSTCGDQHDLTETSKCDGIKIGSPVNFTAEIQVTRCPENRTKWHQKFEIYPVGINESLTINLEMICDCDCEREGHSLYKQNSTRCNGQGILKCGICECNDDHFGESCECNGQTKKFETHTQSCRPDNTTSIDCSGRGACICGQCKCNTNSNEGIHGQFCECDNSSCDRSEGYICANHGKCECGRCECNVGWSGPSCNCKTSNDSCIAPGTTKICSGHGVCKCNECVCHNEGDERYSGKYCDKCPTCPSKCEELKSCVQCRMYQTGNYSNPTECEEKCMQHVIESVETVTVDDEDRVLCYGTDEDDCKYAFVYYYDENNSLKIEAQTERECPAQVYMLGIVLGVIAAVVLIGLALLLLWKLLTTIHDRREFAKFEKERMMAKWDTGENPIYKQATSTFKNPTYAGK